MGSFDWSKAKTSTFESVPEQAEPETDHEAAAEDWDAAAPTATADVFEDPQVQDQGPAYPEFLGKRWREITDPGLKRQAWAWLREWTEWFVVEFDVASRLVPPCWFMHQEIVAELWALANAETKVWEEKAPSTMPLTGFHNYLPGALERLRAVQSTGKCLSQKQHVVPARDEDGWDRRLQRVDERLWADHLVSITDEEPQVAPGRWRMGVRTAAGVEATSAPIQVPAAAEATGPVVDDPFFGFDGEGRPMLRATATGTGLVQSWWEREDASGDWVVAEKSRRDISQEIIEEDEQDA